MSYDRGSPGCETIERSFSVTRYKPYGMCFHLCRTNQMHNTTYEGKQSSVLWDNINLLVSVKQHSAAHRMQRFLMTRFQVTWRMSWSLRMTDRSSLWWPVVRPYLFSFLTKKKSKCVSIGPACDYFLYTVELEYLSKAGSWLVGRYKKGVWSRAKVPLSTSCQPLTTNKKVCYPNEQKFVNIW
jgi:hypothetical protein